MYAARTSGNGSRRVDQSRFGKFTAVLVAALMATTGLLVNIQATPPAAAATWDPPATEVAAADLQIYMKEGEHLWAYNPAAWVTNLKDQDGNAIPRFIARTPTDVATASADGVWTVTGSGRDWMFEVRDADGNPIPGRVWTESIKISQSTTLPGMDLNFHVVNDTGYIYELDLLGFQGIASNLQANATGVPTSGTDCRPTYQNGGSKIPTPDCGGVYRIFFDEPAADLPATANRAGEEVTILPEPLQTDALKATTLTYTAAEPETTNPAGTFDITIDERFIGTAVLQIDVDGDGSYDGPRDVSVDQYANGVASLSYAWDGKDANGVPVVIGGKKLNARMKFDRLGEVHVTLLDVEGRDGIRFVRKNGPGAPDPTIYFNDTYKDGSFDVSSGPLDPVDSSDGVHGWPFYKSNTRGHGNDKNIDDWTYMSLSDVASTDLPFGGFDKLELTASADKDTYSPGDEVTITYELTNSGTSDLDAVSIVGEEWTGTGDKPAVTCTPDPTDIPAGGKATCTLTYTATDDDALVENIVDKVHATGNLADGSGTLDSNTDQVELTPVPDPSLAVEVTADKDEFVPGEPVTYTYQVTNDGNQTIDGVTVATDSFTGSGTPSDVTCAPTELAPGEEATCTSTYTPTAADVGKKTVSNTVHATGEIKDTDTPVNSPQGSVPITASEPAIAVEVAADKDVYAEGETITYTYTVSNTGDRDLGNITIPKGSFSGTGTYPDEVTCTPDTLPAGSTDTATCTVEYVATAEDVARGSINNTAAASSDVVDSEGAVVGTEKVTSDPVSVKEEAAKPALSVTSDLDDKLFEEGKPLNYTYTVTNDGNVPLTDVGVAKNSFNGDNTTSFPDNVTCTPTTLQPGEQATCQASYTPTAADVERGSITAVASAVGTPPAGDPITSPTTTEVAEVSDPELTIEVATDAEMFVAGEPVEYTYTVKNTGNEPLDEISVAEDSFTGDGTWGELTCSPTDLDPGAEATCTRSYTPTTADETRGTLANAVHATGKLDSGTAVESKPGTKTIEAEDPELTVDVTVDNETFTGPGETLSYTYEVTNTGNVPIDEIAIDNTSFSGNGTPPAPTNCSPTTLQPGEKATCTATYETVQADLDQGSVNNIATATGQRVGSDTDVASKPDDAYSDADNQKLTITAVDTPEVFRADEPTSITYTVRNDGTDPVTDPALVTDTATGGSPAGSTSCTPNPLPAGAEATCVVNYTPTQDDVDRGSIVSSAHAAGTVEGTPVASDPKPTDIPAAKPALEVSASIAPTDFVEGDELDFEFVVTNTGNVDMTDIGIDPASFSGGTFPEVTCPTGPVAPGDSVTCTAKYTATADDAEAGKVSMVVAAEGTSVGGTPVQSKTDPAAVSADGRNSELEVSVTPDRESFVEGEDITYNYEITNTGTTTIENPGINNATFTGSGTAPTPTNCTPTTLAPGEKATCSASYTPTAEDVANETIDYVASATGTVQGSTPEQTVESTPDSASTPVAEPELTLTTTATPDDKFIAGQEVSYTYEIENTGDKPIENIALEPDTFTGTGTPSTIACVPDPLPTGGLARGEKLTCTQTYTATEADAARGSIINNLHATGDVVGSTETVETDPVANKIAAADPELAVTVTADKDSFVPGEPVTYTYEVENTGDVTVDDVTIAPDNFTGSDGFPSVTCTPTSLAAGEKASCTAVYTPTDEDFGAKTIGNIAHATGNVTPPGTTDKVAIESPQAAVNTPAAGPKLALTASVDQEAFVEGSELNYTFKVTNPGDREVDDLSIDLPAGFSDPVCSPTSLKPGDPAATCTASYTATAADATAGTIEVPAKATGEVVGTDSAVVSTPSTLETPVAAPALSIVGKADKETFVDGEDITYTYVVTNTGDVPLTDITMKPFDDAIGFSGSEGYPDEITCEPKDLAPREQATCSMTYTASWRDYSSSEIDNGSVATGTVPGSPTQVDSNQVDITTIAAEPSIALTGGPDRERFTAGDPITYTYEVTNTGDKPLEDISIDPAGFPGSPTFTCTPTELPVGSTEKSVCTATYVATQEDVDRGMIEVAAVAEGNVAGTDTPVFSDSVPDYLMAFNPELALTVTADKDEAVAGEVINYTYTVTNTGEDTVENLTINEGNFTGTGGFPSVTCAETTLAPGAETTCTASYTVTEQDAVASSITNSAEAAGTVPNPDDPGSATPVNSNLDAVTTDILEPGIAVTSSIDKETFAAGDKLTLTFEVENTGEVPLTDVKVTPDKFTGTGPFPSEITCEVTELAVGEKTICTAEYIATPEDVEQGNIVAVARAEAYSETTPPVASKSDPTTVVAKNGDPILTIDASADSATFVEGLPVEYTFEVTNTSETDTVENVTVDNYSFNGENPFPAGTEVTCDPSTLAPGEQVSCTASYTPTAADAGKPALTATVVATGTLEKADPGDPDVATTSLPDDVRVELERPALTLSSELDATEFRVGEELTISYEVTNTGNVPLTDVVVDPISTNASGVAPTAVCSPTDIPLGGTTTCTITYVPTEADAARGSLDLTAQATGTSAFSPATGISNTTTESVEVADPALGLEISVDKPGYEAGDTLTYSFSVENTGGVPLEELNVVIDSFSGTGEPPVIICDAVEPRLRSFRAPTGAPASKDHLSPNQTLVCTATYVATAADVSAGQIDISAHAVGINPADGAQVLSPSAALTITSDPLDPADPDGPAGPGEPPVLRPHLPNTGR